MKIYIEKEDKEKKITFSGSVKDLLKKLGIVPEDVIVSCNDEIVFDDYDLNDSDDIKILSVISGG